jgi:hypothetical protein
LKNWALNHDISIPDYAKLRCRIVKHRTGHQGAKIDTGNFATDKAKKISWKAGKLECLKAPELMSFQAFWPPSFPAILK